MSATDRIRSLDSLRGLAALAVVFHHCLLVFPAFYVLQSDSATASSPGARLLAFSPLHIGWAGTEAVILFFVLSGFVLALPFVDGRTVVTSRFMAKRVCRIYLPYIVAVAISTAVLLTVAFESIPGASRWFNDMWSYRPSVAGLLDIVTMGGRETHNVDTATWSLVHEMRVSLLFPLLAFLVTRFNTRLIMGAGFALSLAGYAESTPGGFESLSGTAFYLGFFIFGAVLARHRSAVSGWMRRITADRRATAAVIAAAGCLYLWRWLVPFAPARNAFVVAWMVAMGSALLFALVLGSERVASPLACRPLQWLGRVSYSLYLTHTIVLLAMVHAFAGTLPLELVVGAVPLVALPVAAAFYRFVEGPSMRLAKRLEPTKETASKTVTSNLPTQVQAEAVAT